MITLTRSYSGISASNASAMEINENTFNAHKYQIGSQLNSMEFPGCFRRYLMVSETAISMPYSKAQRSSEIPVQGLPRNFSCAFGLVGTRSVGSESQELCPQILTKKG